jgi:hypothetical protein
VFALAATLMMGIHLAGARAGSRPWPWQILLTAGGNLLAVFLTFTVLLEFCRLRFRRHARAIFGLALLVLCALPVLVGSVFFSHELWRFSLLAPGVLALAGPESTELNLLGGVTLIHLALTAGLAIAWKKEWRRFLNRQPERA